MAHDLGNGGFDGQATQMAMRSRARSACAEHRGLDSVERPQNQKVNHPRPRLIDTSRVDGVKAPQHRGTPGSAAVRQANCKELLKPWT